MVKKVLLFIMVLVSMSTSAEDFTAVIDGETFTFRVLSSSGVLTCELTGVENENITSVTLPLSVKYNMQKYNIVGIGDNAFNSVKLKTFKCEYPQYIEYIGYRAFVNCDSLQSLDFSEFTSLKEIGEVAFCRCSSLTSIKFPNSVTSIGKYLFSGSTNLTSIIVEKGNPTYDSRDNCNAIIETASNTLIAGCKNTVIPNSVTSIGRDAFFGCSSLISIEIPKSVTSIGDNAFYGCSSLISIEIPNSVTSIRRQAFDGCSSLISIEIPKSVTSIGNYAFSHCESLKLIYIYHEIPLAIDKKVFKIDSYTDGFDYDNCILFVPYGSIDLYKKAEVWSQFKNILGFSSPSTISEDVNGDGVVNSLDVLKVYKYMQTH